MFLKNLRLLFTKELLITCTIAIALTLAFLKLDITFNIPTQFITIAFIFPVVFGINAAYQRRESVLTFIAEVRSNATNLYFIYYDYSTDEKDQAAFFNKLRDIFSIIEKHLSSSVHSKNEFNKIYSSIFEISKMLRNLHTTRSYSPEVARAFQFLRDLNSSLEKINMVAIYRTPHTLRKILKIFSYALPIFLTPYFGFLAKEYFLIYGLLICVLYTFIFQFFENIQRDLEDPFDGIGMDDVQNDYLDFLNNLEKTISISNNDESEKIKNIG